MKKNELTKELTPKQKRLIMKVSLSHHFLLSDEEAMELLNLPHDIMREQLSHYIDSRQSLPDAVVAQIFKRHKEIGDDMLELCLDKLSEFPDAAQVELFNLPEKLRDKLLLKFVKKSSRHFCDEAVMKILDLPQEMMMKVITTYLGHGSIPPREAQLKIACFEQSVAEKIFSVYRHIPRADVFDVVFEKWDATARKKFFLDNIKKIGSFEFNNCYGRLERILDLSLKFPAKDRDKLLSAFFDRGYMDVNLLKKVCTIEEPSRKRLLMRKLYSTDAIDVLMELPLPTRTELLIHQIKNDGYCNFSSQQIKKFFSFPEPYCTRVLKAYVKRYDNLFEYAKEEVMAMPEPLRTELVLNSITSWNSKELFKLPEPLRTKALCAYFSTDEPEENDLFMVYELPDETRTPVLLAAITAGKNRYLFEYGHWGSPLKRMLFELPEPSRTEVVTAYVENGWELDEPWMLWLLPKKTRDPLIEVYAAKHKRFNPSCYEEKIKELLGEVPD